jgi:4-alpha-glucanotransferase
VIEEKIGLPFIAEDLGIITKEVEDLRDEFNLPGMRVLQFAFDKSKNNPYLPHNYTKNSVVYTGTHDNDTSIGWYRKATEFEKDFLRRYMNTPANRPSWDLIRLAMSSAADTAIFPLQDVLELGSEARMNTPGTESGNWQWRYKKGDLTEERINELKYLCKIFKR